MTGGDVFDVLGDGSEHHDQSGPPDVPPPTEPPDGYGPPGRLAAGVGGSRPPAPRTSWTGRDLMAATFPEPRFAVPGLIPEGLTLLAGAPKLGKSWLMLGVAVAVAAGGRALGKIAVGQGDALYLALEDPPRRLETRLRQLLGGDGCPDGLHLETAWPTMADGGAKQLNGWLTTYPGCRLVVVDVLARVRGGTDDRASRYDADYAALAPLKALADAHQVAVVVVHHVRKASAEDFLETVSGTNGLAGAADSVLVLTRARTSADAVLNLTGRDVEEAKLALRFNPALGAWALMDGVAADYELTRERRDVLDLLRSQGPMRPRAIAEALDRDRAAVRQLLGRMVTDDQLDTADGIYVVPLSQVSQQSQVDIAAGQEPEPPVTPL